MSNGRPRDYTLVTTEERAVGGLREWMQGRLRSLATLQRNAVLVGVAGLALGIATVVIVSIMLSSTTKHHKETTAGGGGGGDSVAAADYVLAQQGAFAKNDVGASNMTLYVMDALAAATSALITDHPASSPAWAVPPSECIAASNSTAPSDYSALDFFTTASRWRNTAITASGSATLRYFRLTGATAVYPNCQYLYKNLAFQRNITVHLQQIVGVCRPVVSAYRRALDAMHRYDAMPELAAEMAQVMALCAEAEFVRSCQSSFAMSTTNLLTYQAIEGSIEPFIVRPSCLKYPTDETRSTWPVPRGNVYPGYAEDNNFPNVV